jgi:hypothetical protein
MKKVAILQSNYIPWKGYFDIIASVDEFIIFDEMQFTKRDWRNRNLIKTPSGKQWLTVPVKTKDKFHQKICETEIDGVDWKKKHLDTIKQNYSRANFFKEIYQLIEPIYCQKNHLLLSDLNLELIQSICGYLKINTKISSSSNFSLADKKTDRLVSLCKASGANIYLSGPSALNYIEESKFTHANIELEWFDYSKYPIYPQLWGDFEHEVSILDLLFNCGENAVNFL